MAQQDPEDPKVGSKDDNPEELEISDDMFMMDLESEPGEDPPPPEKTTPDNEEVLPDADATQLVHAGGEAGGGSQESAPGFSGTQEPPEENGSMDNAAAALDGLTGGEQNTVQQEVEETKARLDDEGIFEEIGLTDDNVMTDLQNGLGEGQPLSGKEPSDDDEMPDADAGDEADDDGRESAPETFGTQTQPETRTMLTGAFATLQRLPIKKAGMATGGFGIVLCAVWVAARVLLAPPTADVAPPASSREAVSSSAPGVAESGLVPVAAPSKNESEILLPDFIVPLGDQGGEITFARLQVMLTLSFPGDSQDAGPRKDMRAAVYGALAHRQISDVTGQQYLEAVQMEIMSKLNETLKNAIVTRVLIDDIVLI